jgi:hypothetical protein
MVRLFEIGDYVRVRRSKFVPAGAVGRVTLVLDSITDVCFVQFDGYDRPTLMREGDLAPVPEEPATEHTVL